jgi:glycosyltransferase involved in cell wall biosynthesis
MASGGVAFVGATGEDYAISFENSIVLETDDPEEIVGYVQFLCDHPSIVERVRAAARETARRFTWDEVIENLLGRLRYLSAAQGVH